MLGVFLDSMVKIIIQEHMNQIYSGITRGRVLNGELYTKNTEINLSMFVYRLFREAFTPLVRS